MKKIPEAALALHTAVLGMTGSGKTNTTKVAIEQVYAEGARVCILDPIKSDWWGLTSSADGTRPGLPFHILGGKRGHVPLHSGAGAAIGKLVAKGGLRHSIIDMKLFEPGGQVRFFCDFIPALLQEMRGFTYLVLEEAHIFAPKERGGVGNENMSVHWAKMVATAGRSEGIRLIVATQRTQSLHNAVLGSCQTLIAHQLTAPADQEPVLKWLKAHIRDAEARAQVADTLGSLDTGEGWIVSGKAGIAEMRQFPKAATYDNTATPTEDDTEHEVTTAAVDQAALRAIIGDAVAGAAENDPKLLRARIAELEKDAGAPAGATPGELAAAEARGRIEGLRTTIAWFRQGFNGPLQQIRAAVERFELESTIISSAADSIGAELEKEAPDNPAFLSSSTIEVDKGDAPVSGGKPWVSPGMIRYGGKPGGGKTEAIRRIDEKANSANSTQRGTSAGSGTVTDKAQRTFLTVLAQHRHRLTRNQVAIFAGYSSKSSHVDNTISRLRVLGYVSGGRDGIEITPDGRKALGKYEPLPTGRALQEYWIRELDGAGAKFLTIICAAYPRTLTRDQVAEKAGYSTGSSHVDNTLSTLRTRGLISGGRGEIKASEELFG